MGIYSTRMEIDHLARPQRQPHRLLVGVCALILLIGPVLAEISYTVQPGDSVEKIAHRYAVPVEVLTRINGIIDPDRIGVGDVLYLPDDAKPVPESTRDNAVAPPAGQSTAKPAATEQPSTPPQQLSGRSLTAARAQWVRAHPVVQGKRLVAAARSMAGTPYNWGGSTSRGVDCSGLIVRAMGKLGRRVPHNAASLFKMGTPVPISKLRPGDLVFFHTTRAGVSHVGIWIGNNKFMHSSTGRGVVQDELKGYYAQRFVGARRF